MALRHLIAYVASSKPDVIGIANTKIQVANLHGLVVEDLKMIPWDKSLRLIAISHPIKDDLHAPMAQ
jgi:hypothetical protein